MNKITEKQLFATKKSQRLRRKSELASTERHRRYLKQTKKRKSRFGSKKTIRTPQEPITTLTAGCGVEGPVL